MKFEINKDDSFKNMELLYEILEKFYFELSKKKLNAKEELEIDSHFDFLGENDDISYFITDKYLDYLFSEPNPEIKQQNQYLFYEMNLHKNIFEIFIFFLRRTNNKRIFDCWAIIIALFKILSFSIDNNPRTTQILLKFIYLDEIFQKIINSNLKKTHHIRIIIFSFLVKIYKNLQDISDQSIMIYKCLKKVISENLDVDESYQNYIIDEKDETLLCKSCFYLSLFTLSNMKFLLDCSFENQVFTVLRKEENRMSKLLGEYISIVHKHVSEGFDAYKLFAARNPENFIEDIYKMYCEFYIRTVSLMEKMNEKNEKFFEDVFEPFFSTIPSNTDSYTIVEIKDPIFEYNYLKFYTQLLTYHEDSEKAKMMKEAAKCIKEKFIKVLSLTMQLKNFNFTENLTKYSEKIYNNEDSKLDFIDCFFNLSDILDFDFFKVFNFYKLL